MRVQTSLKFAWSILVHSKLRSWLTIIGIVIGVAAIVAIVSIGEGAQANVQARLGGLGADIITISPGFQRAAGGFSFGGGRGGGGGSQVTTSKSKNITNVDIQNIRSIEGIAFIDGIISGREDMVYLAQTSSVSIQGVDTLSWPNMITTELDSGRYLGSGDSNSVVIGNRLAKSTFKQQLGLNQVISIDGSPFKIVGVLKQVGSGDDNLVFMPIRQAREILKPGSNNFDSIVIKVNNPDMVDLLVNETNDKLSQSRHVTDKTKDFTVTSAKAAQERIAGVTQTFTLFLGAIAAVSLIVGAVGIANTMFTSVLEKTKEIGVMKAIGAKNSDIMGIFLINSGFVGLVGGIVGIIIGVLISGLLPSLLSGIGLGPGGPIKTVIPTSLLVEALLISVGIGMIAGAIPAYNASKLKPVDALRYQ